MKHSTCKPNKAEAKRMDAIKNGPCLCCLIRGKASKYPDIHHLLSGNRRRGHMFTIGLCPWHHRGVRHDGWIGHSMRVAYGPSLADGSKPFHAEFGSDDDLLKMQDELFGTRAAA